MDVVCLGEALIDFKGTGPLNFEGHVGGSPLNVAVAASRLDVRAGFASQLSTDLFGLHIRSYLAENGVDATLVLDHDAPSTLAFVEEQGGDAHFSFLSNGAANTLYDPRPRPSFPASVQFVQFGSISLLAEPAATAIKEIVEAHRDRCTILLDPNVRPALIAESDGYLSNLSRWLRLSHLVKTSRQDLEWLYPQAVATEAARAWLELGPRAVIVTRGSQGATLLRKGHVDLEMPARRVTVVDTVGAGDAFTGAIIVSLLEAGARDVAAVSDDTWRRTLLMATAAAALNCTRAGAQPPTRQELDQFMEEQ